MPKRVSQKRRQEVLREFMKIPGVGKSIAQDLWNLGLRAATDLKKKDPERLYDDECSD